MCMKLYQILHESYQTLHELYQILHESYQTLHEEVYGKEGVMFPPTSNICFFT